MAANRISANSQDMNGNIGDNNILAQMPLVVTPEGTTLMNSIPGSHFDGPIDSIVDPNKQSIDLQNSSNNHPQDTRLFSVDPSTNNGLNVSTPDLLTAYTDQFNDTGLADQHALVSYVDDNSNNINSNNNFINNNATHNNSVSSRDSIYSNSEVSSNNQLARLDDDSRKIVAPHNGLPSIPHKKPAFVSKVWTMVNDKENKKYIDWSEDGKSIHVFNREEFMKKVLPKFFKHNNFSSFVRQLNMYGWHKVQDLDSGNLLSTEECLEFENPYFIRGREDLLDQIVRNKSSSSANNSNHANNNNSDTNGDKESTMSEKDIQKVLAELEFLKKKQRVITEDLRRVRLDNEILWKENFIARERHKTQSQTLDKILRFLATIYGNNATRLLEDQQFQMYSGANGGNNGINNLNNNNSNNGYQPNDNSMVPYPFSVQSPSQAHYSNQAYRSSGLSSNQHHHQQQPLESSSQSNTSQSRSNDRRYQSTSYNTNPNFSQQQQQHGPHPESSNGKASHQKPMLMIAHNEYNNPLLSPNNAETPVSDQIQEIKRESPKVDNAASTNNTPTNNTTTTTTTNNNTNIDTANAKISNPDSASPVSFYTNLASTGLTPQIEPFEPLANGSTADIIPIESEPSPNSNGPYKSNQIETVSPSDGGNTQSNRSSTTSLNNAATPNNLTRPGLERNNSSVIMSDIEKNLYKQQTQLEQINDYLQKFHNFKDANDEFSMPAPTGTYSPVVGGGPGDLIDDDFKVDDFFVSQTPTELFTPGNAPDFVGDVPIMGINDGSKDNNRIAEILDESPVNNATTPSSNTSADGNSSSSATTPGQRKRASVSDFSEDIASLPPPKKKSKN